MEYCHLQELDRTGEHQVKVNEPETEKSGIGYFLSYTEKKKDDLKAKEDYKGLEKGVGDKEERGEEKVGIEKVDRIPLICTINM
jgi:hypothetical protein